MDAQLIPGIVGGADAGKRRAYSQRKSLWGGQRTDEGFGDGHDQHLDLLLVVTENITLKHSVQYSALTDGRSAAVAIP
jgi:hypothetical protein